MATGGLDQLFQTTGGSVWLQDISESHRGNSDTASWIKYDSEHRHTNTQVLAYTPVYVCTRLCFWAHTFAVVYLQTQTYARKCTQTLVLTRRRKQKHSHSLLVFSAHTSIHTLRLVFLPPHLLSYFYTHTHTSSQWCITCSGLAQSPPVPVYQVSE